MNEPLEAVTGPSAEEPVRAATTRVFLALAPPDDAKEELARALRPAYDAYPRMRWNRIEDWHITLAFLGELPVAAVPPLMPPLAGLAAGRAPLGLALRGGGHFDERVLWSGVTGDLDELHRLAADVRARVRECGVLFPERPFRPHLTLARSRRGDHAATVRAAAGSHRSSAGAGRPGACTWSAATSAGVRDRSTTAPSWPGSSVAVRTMAERRPGTAQRPGPPTCTKGPQTPAVGRTRGRTYAEGPHRAAQEWARTAPGALAVLGPGPATAVRGAAPSAEEGLTGGDGRAIAGRVGPVSLTARRAS